MHAAIDLAEKLATFTEAWQPRTVSLFNGHDVMVANCAGNITGTSIPTATIFFLCWPVRWKSISRTAQR